MTLFVTGIDNGESTLKALSADTPCEEINDTLSCCSSK